MIGGEQRTHKARKVGMTTLKVVAINPTQDEIKALYEMDEDPKEPEYFSEKDVDVPDHIDGDEVVKVTKTVQNARIDFYFKDTVTDMVVKKSFFLQNRFQQKKDLTKTQFVNQLGKTAWVDESRNLPARFTSYLDKAGNPTGDILFRTALIGEVDLIEFLMVWLNIDTAKPSANFLLEIEEFFKGNFKELQDLLSTTLPLLVTGCYTVITNEKDGNLNYYQDLYKKFLPAFDYKFFTVNDFNEDRLKEIADKKVKLGDMIKAKERPDKGDWLTRYEKWILDITDREYGCSDSYSLKPASDFDPTTHISTTAKVLDDASDEY